MGDKNEIQGKLGTLTKFYNWFDKLRDNSKVILLALIIAGVFGYLYIENEKKEDTRVAEQIKELKNEVEACAEAQKQLEEYKTNSLLLQASHDFSPNAQWLTAVGTNQVLWVNKAYEEKYLKPLGLSANDLIGTDGTEVFGEEVAKEFAENNDFVLRSGKPIVFKEVVKTLKFEVKIGNFTYAIGGIEYEEF